MQLQSTEKVTELDTKLGSNLSTSVLVTPSKDGVIMELAQGEDKAVKLIAYTRVSSENQIENTSLENQIQSITTYCKAHGHQLVANFSDEGISGKNFEDRPGLQKALKMLADGLAEGIIVAKLDRLSRSAVDLFTFYKERLEEDKKHLVVLDSNIDTTTTAGFIAFGIFAVFAETERRMIADRMASGRKAKKAAATKYGEGFTGGSVPFGWQVQQGKLIPDPAELAIRDQIFEMRKAGASYAKIAAAINSEGHKTKRGKKFHATTIKRALEFQPTIELLAACAAS